MNLPWDLPAYQNCKYRHARENFVRVSRLLSSPEDSPEIKPKNGNESEKLLISFSFSIKKLEREKKMVKVLLLLQQPEFLGTLLAVLTILVDISFFFFLNLGWIWRITGMVVFSLFGLLSSHLISQGGRFHPRKTPDLRGSIVIVTGGNSGIGLETTKKMVEWGAEVILAARDRKAGEATTRTISDRFATTPSAGTCTFMHLDLTDLKSVAEFARNILSREKPIDLLINNAGVMMCPFSVTAQGFELQFGTNHLGHFLLTILLLPALRLSAAARVVNLSSLAHVSVEENQRRGKSDDLIHYWKQLADAREEFIASSASSSPPSREQLVKQIGKALKYEKQEAYAFSKLANIYFTKALDRRFQQESLSVSSYAVHPGVVRTNLARHLSIIKDIIMIPSFVVLKSPINGAQTTFYASLDEMAQRGGYFADCKQKAVTKLAEREEEAENLWKISLRIINADESLVRSLLTAPIDEARAIAVNFSSEISLSAF